MSFALSQVCLSHGAAARSHVLDGVDLGVAAGERVAVIGPSGAGKTSLLRLVATALRPSSGELQVLGSDPWQLSSGARQRLRSRIGLIHQAPPLPPRQRVVTAVAAGRLGRWSLGKGLLNLLYPLDIDSVSATLARLDLADKVFNRCDQLSGGELQRVGIARVLYQQPELVLADEPVSAMDPVLADHTTALLVSEAEARNMTLVASLHNVELAVRHFPRIIGLRDGRILFDRPAADVGWEELQALYANELLQSQTSLAPLNIHIPRC